MTAHSSTLFAWFSRGKFFADFCTGRIWGASRQQASAGWATTELLDTSLVISTFGEDEAGELYVVHYSATGGAIYRIIQFPKASPIPWIRFLLLND